MRLVGLADAFGPQGEALAVAAREAFAVGLSASMWVEPTPSRKPFMIQSEKGMLNIA